MPLEWHSQCRDGTILAFIAGLGADPFPEGRRQALADLATVLDYASKGFKVDAILAFYCRGHDIDDLDGREPLRNVDDTVRSNRLTRCRVMKRRGVLARMSRLHPECIHWLAFQAD